MMIDNRYPLVLTVVVWLMVAGVWGSVPDEQETPESYAVAAKKLYEKGDLTGSLLGYDKAISLAQKRPAYYYERALVKMGLGKPKHAVIDLSIATAFDGKFSDAWHLMGKANYVAGDFEEAARSEYIAVLLDKKRADYWLWAGIAARKIGDDGAAISYLEESTKLNENDPQAWYHLGLAYAAERESIKGADRLTKAIEMDDTDAAFYKARAFCYLQASIGSKNRDNFLKAADDDINAAWTIQPDIPDRQSLKATFLYLNDGATAAIAQLKRDLNELSHTEKAIVQMRLWALHRLAENKKAAREALSFDPKVLDVDRRQLLSCLLDRMDPDQLNNQVYDIDMLSERWFLLGIKMLKSNKSSSTMNLELCSVRPFNFEGIMASAVLLSQQPKK